MTTHASASNLPDGERTVRTNELPVMFPDDPAGLQTIARLMRW